MMNAPVVVPPVPLTSVLSPQFDKTRITKENLDLGPISENGKLAFLLYNVFSTEECVALIKISEDSGYIDALVNTGDGREMLIKGYRDSMRVLIDDRDFVKILYQRISAYLPNKFMNENLVEINERLRFLRYDPGDKFEQHYDGSYCRPDNSAGSVITLQIYLNEDFDGGETTFLEIGTNNCVPVKPKTGMILVFEHKIFHEGSLVKQGRKYTIRTDVLYTRGSYCHPSSMMADSDDGEIDEGEYEDNDEDKYLPTVFCCIKR